MPEPILHITRTFREEHPMFEIGDTVRVVSNGEIRRIVGIGPGEFFTTQIGKDASTVKPIKGSDLELMAKAPKPDTGPCFVPNHSIIRE
jgi:hypothetical protein